MTAQEQAARALLDDLATANVGLYVEAGTLKHLSPKGALTPELRERLKPLRDEVIAILAGLRRAGVEAGRASAPLTAAPLAPGTNNTSCDIPAITDPVEHWRDWGRHCPLLLAPVLAAIVKVLPRTKLAEIEVKAHETATKRVPSYSLRAEYGRLVALAENDPGAITAPWLAEQARAWARAAKPEPAIEAEGWDGHDAAELVAWAMGLTPADLPPVPFVLGPGVTVVGPAFLPSLLAELAAGPRSPRVRTGVLQRDLERLREASAVWVIERDRSPEPEGLRLLGTPPGVDIRRDALRPASNPAPNRTRTRGARGSPRLESVP